MTYQNALEFARQLDAQDELKSYKEHFLIPQHNGQAVVYLCGNSLGLQPKTARMALEEEMLKWEKFGVDGHFEGKNRWFEYRKSLKPMIAGVVGGKEAEVTVMNNLSSNLHLMMVSFYQPKGKRTKIIMEAGAFPSDQYAMETQVKYHHLNPDEHIIELTPRTGEHTLRTEDILAKIEETGEELALVLMGGVNYYTGQAFEMEKITAKAHQVGAFAGFDLAHAVGNLKLQLHNWQVDFAVWCSYKYLNSSPGGVGGIFVHENHHKSNLPRFGGWWGHNEEERFQMLKGFKPIEGADGWQLANEPILPMAVHRVSLEIFNEVGMDRLVAKSKQLTGFLEFILRSEFNDSIEIITPADSWQRGCQLSLFVKKDGKKAFEKLLENNIIADWREPNVIRMSPVPLYNTFEDVFKIGQILKQVLL